MMFGYRVRGVMVGMALLFGASGCANVVIIEGGKGEATDELPGAGDPQPSSPSLPPVPPVPPSGPGSSEDGSVLQDCATEDGYELSSYTAGKEGSPALRIVGVYETRSDHSAGNHPAGSATVSVERPGSNVLVLSSYEPTAWTVTAGPGAKIERVILDGYYAQTVTVPPGAAVEDFSGLGNYFSACGYAWPNNSGGCDTPALVAGAEKVSGLKLSSFHGCYRMTKLVYLPEE